MTKHAPGPWKWVMEDPECMALYGPNGLWDHVLWTQICPACAERGNRCTAPNEANARLIAAAPDMYDALKSLENDAGQMPPFMWDIVQAAIAKAEATDEG